MGTVERPVNPCVVDDNSKLSRDAAAQSRRHLHRRYKYVRVPRASSSVACHAKLLDRYAELPGESGGGR